MTRIDLPTGEIIFLDETNPQEVKNLIEQNMGNDIAFLIQELIDAANYTEKKVDTDLDSYEASLESWNCVGTDILEIIQKCDTYLRESKRIDRDTIFHMMNEIEKLINNIM